MRQDRAIELLREEWEGIPEKVQKITKPDPSNPTGPETIIAVQIPSGYWLMLQARIQNLLDAN